MSDSIVLSSRDTDRFQEIAVDRAAAKITVDAAIAFHLNHVAEIIKSEKLLWDHITEAYNLNPDKVYKAEWSRIDRRMIIVEVEDEDDS